MNTQKGKQKPHHFRITRMDKEHYASESSAAFGSTDELRIDHAYLQENPELLKYCYFENPNLHSELVYDQDKLNESYNLNVMTQGRNGMKPEQS